jgi:hypothetical protein
LPKADAVAADMLVVEPARYSVVTRLPVIASLASVARTVGLVMITGHFFAHATGPTASASWKVVPSTTKAVLAKLAPVTAATLLATSWDVP